MSPFTSWKGKRSKVREEKARLIMRLRDEQHLTFVQIAAQVNMSINWCSQVYHSKKRVSSVRTGL